MKKIRDYIRGDIFLLEASSTILSGILLATVYSLFETPVINVILFGLLEVVLSVPFAFLCHFTNKHRKIGTVICIFIYGGLLFGMSYLSIMGMFETEETFVQWLVQDLEGGKSQRFDLSDCCGRRLSQLVGYD